MRISDWSSDVCSSDLDEHAAAAIFGRVFEQVSDQFVEVLPLDARDERLVACRIETHVGIEGGDRARDAFDAVPDIGARLRGAAAADGAGAGEIARKSTRLNSRH